MLLLSPSSVWLTQQLPRAHTAPYLDAKDKDFTFSWKHCQMDCLLRSMGHLHLGHWFKLIYVWQRIMSWAVPSGGQLINKGVCSLRLLRAQSLQREFKRGPRGVSFGRSYLRAMTSSVWRWFGCYSKANGVFFWGTPKPAICLSDLLVVNLVDSKPWSHQTRLCFELWVLILWSTLLGKSLSFSTICKTLAHKREFWGIQLIVRIV